MYLWEFCSITTLAGLLQSRLSWSIYQVKKGQNWQNYIPKWTKTTSKCATCLLCEEAYYMYEWTLFVGFSSILVTSARSEAFFQRATLPHLFTDTQLSVSVLNFNWTNGNAKLIPLLCLQLSQSFQEIGCFSSKLQNRAFQIACQIVSIYKNKLKYNSPQCKIS